MVAEDEKAALRGFLLGQAAMEEPDERVATQVCVCVHVSKLMRGNCFVNVAC